MILSVIIAAVRLTYKRSRFAEFFATRDSIRAVIHTVGERLRLLVLRRLAHTQRNSEAVAAGIFGRPNWN